MDDFGLILFLVAGIAFVVFVIRGVLAVARGTGQSKKLFKKAGLSIAAAFIGLIIFGTTYDATQTASTTPTQKEDVKKAATEDEADAKEAAEQEKQKEAAAKEKAKADAEAKKQAEEEAAKKKAEEEAKKPKIGDSVKAGDFEYVVTASNEMGEIKSNNQFVDNKTTTGKFIMIDYSVKNNDKKARMVDGNLFILKAGENEYKPMSDADIMVILGDKNLFLEEVNPGLSRNGQLVFEVGSDVTTYELEVSSGLGWSGGEYKTIKLK